MTEMTYPKSYIVNGSPPPQKFEGTVIRFELLEKVLSIMFNFLVNVGKQQEPLYATRFSSTIMKALLTYLCNETFTSQVKVNHMVREYLDDKLKKTDLLLSTLAALGDTALDKEERNIIVHYPSLFWAEMLTPYDINATPHTKILRLIFPKKGPNEAQAVSTKDRLDRADQCLVDLMNDLSRCNKKGLSCYASKVFASLVIRKFLTELMTEQNRREMDPCTLQYVQKKQADFFNFCQSTIQVGKGSMNVKLFNLIEQHPQVFMCSSLVHVDLGALLLELISSSDEHIEQLPSDYLEALNKSYLESFDLC